MIMSCSPSPYWNSIDISSYSSLSTKSLWLDCKTTSASSQAPVPVWGELSLSSMANKAPESSARIFNLNRGCKFHQRLSTPHTTWSIPKVDARYSWEPMLALLWRCRLWYRQRWRNLEESICKLREQSLLVETARLTFSTAWWTMQVYPSTKIHETPEENWDRAMRINLKSMFLGCKYATGQMLKQEPHVSGDRGWIINMASAYALRGGRGLGKTSNSKLAWRQAGIAFQLLIHGWCEQRVVRRRRALSVPW